MAQSVKVLRLRCELTCHGLVFLGACTARYGLVSEEVDNSLDIISDQSLLSPRRWWRWIWKRCWGFWWFCVELGQLGLHVHILTERTSSTARKKVDQKKCGWKMLCSLENYWIWPRHSWCPCWAKCMVWHSWALAQQDIQQWQRPIVWIWQLSACFGRLYQLLPQAWCTLSIHGLQLVVNALGLLTVNGGWISWPLSYVLCAGSVRHELGMPILGCAIGDGMAYWQYGS